MSDLAARLRGGDFLLNLAVDVSSLALINLCWQQGALYLDTCIEAWAELAERLGIKAIHVAERDTRTRQHRKIRCE